jgi:hypothetical protein
VVVERVGLVVDGRGSNRVKCVAIELFAAAWPLGAAALAKGLVQRPGSPWATAALAASGALAGQAALHLTCPVRFAEPHLAVFHTGGVVLAALLGASASRLPRFRAAASPGA